MTAVTNGSTEAPVSLESHHLFCVCVCLSVCVCLCGCVSVPMQTSQFSPAIGCEIFPQQPFPKDVYTKVLEYTAVPLNEHFYSALLSFPSILAKHWMPIDCIQV